MSNQVNIIKNKLEIKEIQQKTNEQLSKFKKG